MEPLLKVEGLSKNFGKFVAVNKLSFEVFEGEIFGIAGPNGAGKTTLFNIITKIPYGPTTGRITLKDVETHKLAAYEICQKGIARTFQIPQICSSLSVLDNVIVGATFGTKAKVKDRIREAMKAVDFVGLIDKKDVSGKDLSLFDKKKCMIASALVMKPLLLLLDEPVAGLNKSETDQMTELIKKIHLQGVTIMIIEHVMAVLMTLSDRVMILSYGEKITEGTPEEVAANENVIKVYLGEKARKE